MTTTTRKPNAPNLDELTKVTETYDNGDTAVLYAAPYCSPSTIDAHSPKFWDHGNSTRPSYSYHKSGVITGNTDRHCVGAPVRRRSVFMEVWSESDQTWMMWHCGPVSSVAQGKRLIERILETGEFE